MSNKQQKYDPKLYDVLVWSLASKGYTNAEICEVIGISERTFLRWRNDHETFRQRFIEGRKIATAQVEQSLFKKATGYEITETEEKFGYDSKGNEVPIGVKKKVKHVVPDTTAIIFWLKNRDSENWKDTVEVENTAGDGLAQSLLTQLRMLDIEALEKKEKEQREAKKKAKRG